jgi:zinc/manganese transport system ATP-binding protein
MNWFRTVRPAAKVALAESAGFDGIRLDSVSVAYQGREVVSGVSGCFAPGQLTAIVGPNGAGKSSLLAAITGRVRPSAGAVLMPAGVRAHLACLPQQAQIERSVPLCVADVVALGLWRELGAFGGMRAAHHARVAQALAEVGLSDAAQRPVAALSAGQFQRMLFARLLLQDARVLLLDEPFNAVDEDTTAALMAIVQRWRGEGRTVIAVLHDLQLVRASFDQILWLNRRCLAWGPTAAVLQARSEPAPAEPPEWQPLPELDLPELPIDTVPSGLPTLGHALHNRPVALHQLHRYGLAGHDAARHQGPRP